MKVQKETAAAQTVLAAVTKKTRPLINRVESLEIKDADSYASAALLISNIKEFAKQAAADRDEIAAPIKKGLKLLTEHFKPFLDQCAQIEEQTKAKMLAFVEQQEHKSERLLSDFESGKIKSLETVVTKQAALNKDLDNSNAQLRKVKDVEIVDAAKIPRKYLMPDFATIKKDLLAGKQIAGAKLVFKTSIAI